MEVEAGYEKTEVGVIPEKWRVKPFVSIVNQYIDYRGRTPKKLGMAWGGGDILALSANNVQMGYIDPDREAYYGSSELYKRWMATGECQKGDVVLTMEAPLGNVAQISDNRKYILSQRVILVKTKGEITNDYLYHFLSGHYFQKELLTYSTGSTAKGIQRQKLDGILIYFPDTIKEQTAIATALSDVDDLIHSLEKLIAKKWNIKQGAMQLLLTGKKRLPGFSGEWITKALGELDEISGAGVDKKIEPNEITVRLVNYMDVYNNNFIYSKNLNFYSSAPPLQAKRCAVKKGDIFFTPSSEMPYDIGLSSVAMEDIPDATYSYHVVRLRLREQWDLTFRTYIFKTRYFLKQAETFCEGSGQRYVITLKKFKELKIRYPADIKEQTAIANVFSDMDAEIEGLEHKLVKYKLIKQGMMQELLTGKTRLM